jgi:hypothetical protein
VTAKGSSPLMPTNRITDQTEGAPTGVRLTSPIEQTVHRLLVRWALRVLRSQESAGVSVKRPVQDMQSD